MQRGDDISFERALFPVSFDSISQLQSFQNYVIWQWCINLIGPTIFSMCNDVRQIELVLEGCFPWKFSSLKNKFLEIVEWLNTIATFPSVGCFLITHNWFNRRVMSLINRELFSNSVPSTIHLLKFNSFELNESFQIVKSGGINQSSYFLIAHYWFNWRGDRFN